MITVITTVYIYIYIYFVITLSTIIINIIIVIIIITIRIFFRNIITIIVVKMADVLGNTLVFPVPDFLRV